MMRTLLLLYSLCWGLGIYAQSGNFEKHLGQQRKEFEAYRRERRSEFEEYRRKRNKEFADYLEKRWKEVEVHRGLVAPTIPKPFVPKPDEEKPDVKPAPEEFPIERVTPAPPVVPYVKPVKIDTPVEPVQDRRLDVPFYGSHYKIRMAEQCRISLSDVNPAGIAAGWRQIAVDESDPLVYDCQHIREQLQLCDYTYYLFVKQVATSALGTQKSNEAVLLTGYILAQSGIDFRFALHGRCLELALAFDVTVYRTSYYSIGKRRYYLMDCEHIDRIQIVQDAYSQDAGVCRLAFSTPMRLPLIAAEARPLISRKYPDMRVHVATNKSLMEAYSKYPKVDWAIYANTPMDETTANKILPAFGNAIDGKSEEEAADMILNFVQTAFTYGYDDEIWGEDRPFFADETLFYPYSDCEDRAILFSQLIQRFTGLDVVLLHYPNHLATAVRFTRDFPGDYVMVDGYKYMVCDPTGYKPIGNAYDEFKNVKAKVIKLNNK